jgi:hypothetical protein
MVRLQLYIMYHNYSVFIVLHCIFAFIHWVRLLWWWRWSERAWLVPCSPGCAGLVA